MTERDTRDTSPLSTIERRQSGPQVWLGGRREHTLTLDEVATILKVHVKMVRKLIRRQYEEDKAAALEGRAPKRVGLRALYVSSRVRRITEQALGEYLRVP